MSRAWGHRPYNSAYKRKHNYLLALLFAHGPRSLYQHAAQWQTKARDFLNCTSYDQGASRGESQSVLLDHLFQPLVMSYPGRSEKSKASKAGALSHCGICGPRGRTISILKKKFCECMLRDAKLSVYNNLLLNDASIILDCTAQRTGV